jgi:hypothetical protein
MNATERCVFVPHTTWSLNCIPTAHVFILQQIVIVCRFSLFLCIGFCTLTSRTKPAVLALVIKQWPVNLLNPQKAVKSNAAAWIWFPNTYREQ